MVIASSALPAPVISCKSALPMEVGRSVTCMSLPSMLASCGKVVTWPSHEPARVFILSNDFCASDFCASDWAKATMESDIRTMDNIRRRDFMFDSPNFFLPSAEVFALAEPDGRDYLGSIVTDIVNYNTVLNASSLFLYFLSRRVAPFTLRALILACIPRQGAPTLFRFLPRWRTLS